jgi:uncharacterized protein YjbJ (UPF0337 family)
MNTEQMQGNWKILKGKVKEQWGKLTDDDFDVAQGKLDQLAGRIAVRYGVAKEEAYDRLQKLETECGCK